VIATIKLSNLVTGRYSPKNSRRIIWEKLLEWLTGRKISLSWTPTVRTAYNKYEKLPKDIERITFEKSIEWFYKNALIAIDRNIGVIEGYQSNMDYEGRQPLRAVLRPDCIAEAAMVFAYHWKLTKNPRSKYLAYSLLVYAWSFQQIDIKSPADGLVIWEKSTPVFYGDDNARIILPTLAVSSILNEDRRDEKVIRCLLANYRTTGPSGFRKNRIELDELYKNGWEYYFKLILYIMLHTIKHISGLFYMGVCTYRLRRFSK